LRLHPTKEPSVALEKDTHPGVENHGVMERSLIGWMDKHLHIRPNLGVLGETKPVKRFEDILMWLAEIGGARECKRRREHIAPPAERMHVGEPRSIGHA
jgi:hypothetical protein